MKELMELSLIVSNCVKCYTVGAECSMAVSRLTANSLKVHTQILNPFCFITRQTCAGLDALFLSYPWERRQRSSLFM